MYRCEQDLEVRAELRASTLPVHIVRVLKFQKLYTLLIASTYMIIMQQVIKSPCIYFYINVSRLLTQLPDLTFAVVSCTAVTDVYNYAKLE